MTPSSPVYGRVMVAVDVDDPDEDVDPEEEVPVDDVCARAPPAKDSRHRRINAAFFMAKPPFAFTITRKTTDARGLARVLRGLAYMPGAVAPQAGSAKLPEVSRH
jgi:hypothetical protein